MNVIDAEVTEVLSEPNFVNNKERFGENHCNWWAVKVKYADMGGGGKKELHFNSKEEAEKVEEGYIFQH